MEDMDIDDYSRDRSRSPVRNRSRSPTAESSNERRDTESTSRSKYGRERRDYGRESRGGRGGRGRGSSRGGRGGYSESKINNDRDYTSGRDYSRSSTIVTSTADAEDYRSKIERNYNNSVFIGNIPFEASATDIEQIFKNDCNIVRADIVTNRGQSRGMATVEFSSQDDVQKAISKFDRYSYKGRDIFVRQDYPPPSDKRDRRDYSSSTNGSSSKGDRDHDSYTRDSKDNRRDYNQSRGSDRYTPAQLRDSPKPGTEIFIGNLPFSVNWQALKDIMREAGEVVRADVRKDSWGRSRGFGTVVFKTEEEANAAVEKFQGYVLEGRSLDARPGKVYNPSEDGNSSASAYQGSASQTYKPSQPKQLNTEFTEGVTGDGERTNTIFAANLPWVTNVDDLYELFETIGRVTKAEVQYNEYGKASGNAVVEFELQELADLAISNLNGYNYGGRDLSITYARRPGSSYPQEVDAPQEDEMALEEGDGLQQDDAVPIDEEA